MFPLDQGRRACAPGRGPWVNAARRLPQDGARPSHRKDRRLDSRRGDGGNTVRDGATRARAWAEPVLVTVRTHDLTTPPCRNGTTCVCRRHAAVRKPIADVTTLQQLRAMCGRDLCVSQKPHAWAQRSPRGVRRSGIAATKKAPRLARCPCGRSFARRFRMPRYWMRVRQYGHTFQSAFSGRWHVGHTFLTWVLQMGHTTKSRSMGAPHLGQMP